MKKKIMITMILSISILFSLLVGENKAANETNNTTTQNSSNTAINKNTTTSTTTKKSSNANLSDLGIKPHDFSGFKSATTSYEVAVPEDTDSVEVYAKTQDTKAKITGAGKKKLEKGENRVEVVVTAEDGTQKTYTINIIREVKQEQEEVGDTDEQTNKVEEGNGLVELKIANVNLSPEFKTDIYEYTAKYIGENTKLEVETKTTDESYVVEVIGNENLQEGENTITILVSGKNGDNIATYQVTVNKSLVDEEAIAREEAEKKEKQQKIIIGAIGVVVVLAIILFIVIKYKRNRDIAEEYYYYDDDDEDEEEMPRALREEEEQEFLQEDFQENEDEEEEIEEMPREKIKEEFLNNYKARDEGIYKEEKSGKHKGKRFK